MEDIENLKNENEELKNRVKELEDFIEETTKRMEVIQIESDEFLYDVKRKI